MKREHADKQMEHEIELLMEFDPDIDVRVMKHTKKCEQVYNTNGRVYEFTIARNTQNKDKYAVYVGDGFGSSFIKFCWIRPNALHEITDYFEMSVLGSSNLKDFVSRKTVESYKNTKRSLQSLMENHPECWVNHWKAKGLIMEKKTIEYVFGV